MPTALLLPLLLASLQAPPPAETPAEVHARFKGIALAPSRLKAEAQRTKGCREDTVPTFTGRFTGYKNGYVSPGKPAGMPQDVSDAEVHTFPVPAFIVQPDKQALTEAERLPRFTEPAARTALAPFTLLPTTGAPMTVPQLGGKVVILHFFNPRCPNAGMLPELIRLQALQANYAFQVVPVAIGLEHPQVLAQFRRLNEQSIPADFQIYLLGGVKDGPRSVFPDFAISPTTYLLDRDGQVAWRLCGALPGALPDRINHLLAEPPPHPPGAGAGTRIGNSQAPF